MGPLPDASKEVLRLYVPVNEALLVHRLHTHHALQRQHENCLHRELSIAVLEHEFEVGPEDVDDHHVEVAFDAVVVDLRESSCSF